MQDPSLLVDNLATALRAIPGVLESLDSEADNVVAYKHSYPEKSTLDQAITRLNPPSVLISHLRTIFGRYTEHHFSLVLRPKGSADALFTAIREGLPTGYGGRKFKHVQVNPSCGLPIFQQYSPRTLVVGDNAYIDIHEITLSLTERGADT